MTTETLSTQATAATEQPVASLASEARPERTSIPIAPASGCCSEAPASADVTPVASILPIVSATSTGESCCQSSQPDGNTNAVGSHDGAHSHGENCSHHAVVADSAAAEAADGVDELDDTALIDALRQVIDPELMINIVDLGLVYSINHTDKKVLVEMTLTSPACPAGPQIISQAKMSLDKVPGVVSSEIKLTMSPPWTPDRMTDDARDQLGIF